MGNKILIVDDVEMNREQLKLILADLYEIDLAENGRKALEMIRKPGNQYRGVLLDLLMPEMDGFAVLEQLKKMDILKKMPVLIISGENSLEIENRCFEMGATEFIHKPFAPQMIRNRVKNVVDLYSYKNELESKVKTQTSTLKTQYKMLQAQSEKLRDFNDKVIEILGTVLEYRNVENGEHIKRVKEFTRILSEQVMAQYPEYGLDDKKIQTIVAACALHDIGKITIPDKILLKPGKYTPEEFEYMKSHTTRGCDVLGTIKDMWNDATQKVCLDICRYHHERFDGKGYPDGLKGEEIPIAAQIFSVVDVYDALVCESVYKEAYSKEKAFHMIVSGECGVFSPKILNCFRMAQQDFEKVVDQYGLAETELA